MVDFQLVMLVFGGVSSEIVYMSYVAYVCHFSCLNLSHWKLQNPIYEVVGNLGCTEKIPKPRCNCGSTYTFYRWSSPKSGWNMTIYITPLFWGPCSDSICWTGITQLWLIVLVPPDIYGNVHAKKKSHQTPKVTGVFFGFGIWTSSPNRNQVQGPPMLTKRS